MNYLRLVATSPVRAWAWGQRYPYAALAQPPPGNQLRAGLAARGLVQPPPAGQHRRRRHHQRHSGHLQTTTIGMEPWDSITAIGLKGVALKLQGARSLEGIADKSNPNYSSIHQGFYHRLPGTPPPPHPNYRIN